MIPGPRKENETMVKHLGLLLIAALAAGLSAAQAPDLARMDLVERSIPDGPVALIDDREVSRDDYLYVYRNEVGAAALAQGKSEASDADRVRAALQALRMLIEQEILVSEAERRGLTIPSAEIDAAYAKRLARLKDSLAKAGKANPTEEDVLAVSGQTREDAKTSMRGSMLAQRLREMLAREAGVSVGPKEVLEFYEGHPELFRRPGLIRLRQIFVRPPAKTGGEGGDWAYAQKEMGKALARIQAGESFDAVARSVSEAPDATKGGDMGMRPVEQMPPFFVEQIQKLKTREMSGIFRSEYGLHLVRLEESKDAGVIPFEDVEESIERQLMGLKEAEAATKYCDPILDDVERVKVFLQLERSLAVLEEEDPSTS